MYRLLFILAAVLGVWATDARAEDFLVRIQKVGYVDAPIDDKEPKDAVLHAVELTVRLETPFASKTMIEKETIAVRGKLVPAKGGTFAGELHYDHTQQVEVPGAKTNPPVGTSMMSSLSLKLGETVMLGMLGSETPGKARSMWRVEVILSRLKSE